MADEIVGDIFSEKARSVRGNDLALRRPRSLKAFGGTLRKRREKLGLTLDDLMAKTRISKPYLSNIETGRAPGPASEEKLRRIAGALGLAAAEVVAGGDWLRAPESVRRMVQGVDIPRRPDGAIDLDAVVGGDRSQKPGVRSQGAEDGSRESQDTSPIPLRAVPLINRVAAGRAAEYTDLDYPAGVADAYVPVPDLPGSPVGSAFALRVVGDSMSPQYAEGEIVVVGPASDEEAGERAGAVADGEDCVVRLGEAENFATTFKRVFYVRDAAGQATAVRLVPINVKYGERVVALEQISGIYPLKYRVVPARKPPPPPT